jgi:hypothetical protein
VQLRLHGLTCIIVFLQDELDALLESAHKLVDAADGKDAKMAGVLQNTQRYMAEVRR